MVRQIARQCHKHYPKRSTKKIELVNEPQALPQSNFPTKSGDPPLSLDRGRPLRYAKPSSDVVSKAAKNRRSEHGILQSADASFTIHAGSSRSWLISLLLANGLTWCSSFLRDNYRMGQRSNRSPRFWPQIGFMHAEVRKPRGRKKGAFEDANR